MTLALPGASGSQFLGKRGFTTGFTGGTVRLIVSTAAALGGNIIIRPNC
jgi:hypothetical protein